MTGVFPLSADVSTDGFEGGEFIAANAAIEDLLLASGSIEEPAAILQSDGDGKRPAIVSDFEGVTSVRLARQRVGLGKSFGEYLVIMGGLDAIGVGHIIQGRAKESEQFIPVGGAYRAG